MYSNWAQQKLQGSDAFIVDKSQIDDFSINMASMFEGLEVPIDDTSNMSNLYQSTYDPKSILQNSQLGDIDQQDFHLKPDEGYSSPESLRSLLESNSIAGSAPSVPPNDWPFNSTNGEDSSSLYARDVSKRSRNDSESNAIAACWTSPICPITKDDGNRPNSCEGECANFLFAHPSKLPDDKIILSDIMAKSRPRVTLERPSRNLKRQNIDTISKTPNLSTTSSKSQYESRISSTSLVTRSSILSTSTITPSVVETKQPKSAKTILVSANALSATKLKGCVPHNQVEKKYRENVNAQLEALRLIVPVSRQQLTGFEGFDLEDLGANNRQASKAVVLSSATAYIKQLEKDTQRLAEEVDSLKTQNKTLQSLIKCDDCSLMTYMKRWRIQPEI